MSDNFKSICGFALICVIIGAIIYGIVMLIYNYHMSQEEKFVEEILKEAITLAEEEGYISTKVKAEIMKKLGNKFPHVEIDGTLQPVEQGEKVYLMLTIRDRKMVL